MSLPSTNTYETVYILKPSLNEKEASVIHDKVDDVIKKFKGSLDARDEWGLKDLAYPINNHRSGRYTVVHYKGNSGVVEEIERHFKISGDVIRYLTVSIEGDYDYKKLKKQMTLQQEEEKKAKQRPRR